MNKAKNETCTNTIINIDNNIICKLYPIKNSSIFQTIISLFNIIDKYELINSKYFVTWHKV